MKRIVLLGLICGLFAGNSGCRVLQCVLYEPLGPGTMCDPTHCTGDCGPPCGECSPVGCGPAPAATCGPADCGPSCAPGPAPTYAGGCGPDCGPACGPSCGTPGDLVCGPGCCHCRGPLAWILHSICPESWCGPSCGEIYWGDFHGDPPDCCDPCDRCGNFTGAECDTSSGWAYGGSDGRYRFDDLSALPEQPTRIEPAPRPAAKPSRTTRR